MKLTRVILCGGLLLAAIKTVDAEPDSRSFSEPARGTRQLISPAAEWDLRAVQDSDNAIAAGATTVIYLNRDGGVYTRASTDDSRTNRSSILPPGGLDYPASDMSEGDWSQVLSCVQSQFAAFNVRVTDVDPGSQAHVEAMVSGNPALLGQNAGVGGIAPFSRTCEFIPNAIVFVFPDALGNDPQVICEVTAQEVAHSFGLDHVFLCDDPMSYLQGCGEKTFQDVSAPCGEFEARECASTILGQEWDCGRAEQNSVQLLADRLGLVGDGNGTSGGVTDPGDVIGGCSTSSGGTKTGSFWLLLGLSLCICRRRNRWLLVSALHVVQGETTTWGSPEK